VLTIATAILNLLDFQPPQIAHELRVARGEPAMPNSKSESKELAERYRQYQKEALDQAQHAKDAKMRQSYLELAEQWRRLADEHGRNAS
jgi:hypothetical protein